MLFSVGLLGHSLSSLLTDHLSTRVMCTSLTGTLLFSVNTVFMKHCPLSSRWQSLLCHCTGKSLLIFLSSRKPSDCVNLPYAEYYNAVAVFYREVICKCVSGKITFLCMCVDVGLRDKISSGSCVIYPHVTMFLGPVAGGTTACPEMGWSKESRFLNSTCCFGATSVCPGGGACPHTAFLVVVLLLV